MKMVNQIQITGINVIVFYYVLSHLSRSPAHHQRKKEECQIWHEISHQRLGEQLSYSITDFIV